MLDTFLDIPGIRGEFLPSPPRSGYDFENAAGDVAVNVRRQSLGTRDLYAGVMELGTILVRTPRLRMACLVTASPRMSLGRLQMEWDKVREVLDPTIASRIALICLTPDDAFAEPAQDPLIMHLANALERESREHSELSGIGQQRLGVTHSYIEVLKILLVRWLLETGPIGIPELAEQSGFSTTTVTRAVDRLRKRNPKFLEHGKELQLLGTSRSLWNELFALSTHFRPVRRYIDMSGKPMSPQDLVDRLPRVLQDGVALGGVPAARFWDSTFNLNGLPRLDLTLHVPPSSTPDLRFIETLDPALKPLDHERSIAPLALHYLTRKEPLFRKLPNSHLQFSDPLEAILDLHELKLHEQADELLVHLRPEAQFL